MNYPCQNRRSGLILSRYMCGGGGGRGTVKCDSDMPLYIINTGASKFYILYVVCNLVIIRPLTLYID